MPKLRLFRRQWRIASDDFALPAFVGIIFRVIWLCIVGYLTNKALRVDLCPSEFRHEIYLVGNLAIFGVALVIEVCLFHFSRRGAVFDEAARSPVATLLYAHFSLYLIELAWTVLGSVWFFGATEKCSQAATLLAQVVVACSWAIIACWLLGMFVLFEFQPGHSPDVWETRFRWLCCCVRIRNEMPSESDFSGRRQVFAVLAREFQELFSSVNLAPTDWMAGFMLVRDAQKSGSVLTPAHRYGVGTTAASAEQGLVPHEVLEEVSYWMTYAMAAYGWMLYVFAHPLSGCCSLGAGGCASAFCCCVDLRAHHPEVDAQRSDESALLETLKARNQTLLFADYSNELLKPAFFVSADHTHRTIAVVVRGTLSVQDLLTDGLGVATDITGLGTGWYGHGGIVDAARYLQSRLTGAGGGDSDGVLTRVFRNDADLVRCGDVSAYKLLLVGHSLGAGTAALTAMLLRPAYPDLRCIAFSPPGLICPEAVPSSKEFITSVVLGKDMVPRLSMHTMRLLRDSLITSLAHSKRSKWELVWGFFKGTGISRDLTSVPASNESTYLIAHDEDIEAAWLPASAGHSEEGASTAHLSDYRPLVLPGRVIHLVADKSSNPRVYDAVWKDSLEFQEILVSSAMIRHHLPNRVEAELIAVTARQR